MLLINQYRRQRRVGDINNFNPCPNDILSPSSIYLLYIRLQFNQFNLYLIIDSLSKITVYPKLKQTNRRKFNKKEANPIFPIQIHFKNI